MVAVLGKHFRLFEKQETVENYARWAYYARWASEGARLFLC